MWPLKTAPSSASKANYSETRPSRSIGAGNGIMKMVQASIEALYGFLYDYGLPLLFFGTLIFFVWVLWAVDFSSV